MGPLLRLFGLLRPLIDHEPIKVFKNIDLESMCHFECDGVLNNPKIGSTLRGQIEEMNGIRHFIFSEKPAEMTYMGHLGVNLRLLGLHGGGCDDCHTLDAKVELGFKDLMTDD